MTFVSNRALAHAGGVIAGMAGLSSLAIWCAGARELPGLFAWLGPVELVIAAIIFTYRRTATVDKDRGLVLQERTVLFLRSQRQIELGAFRRVGVAAAGGARWGTGSFFVDLVGERAMGLPGFYGDRYEAWKQARRLADYLELPLDDRIRVAFFDKRL